ncbi:MAG: TolB family protein [Bryobacteraceae bacterium]
MAAIVIALALVLLTGFVAWFFTSPTPAPSVLRTVQLTHFGVEGNQIVTDGPQIYFVAAAVGHYGLAQVWVSGGEAVPIATPFPNVKLFDISPDHAELLVGSFTGTEVEMPLWTVPASGGSPRRLGNVAGHSGAWSPDGQRIVSLRRPTLYLINRDGSWSPELATAPGKPWQPRWSPDGRLRRCSARPLCLRSFGRRLICTRVTG